MAYFNGFARFSPARFGGSGAFVGPILATPGSLDVSTYKIGTVHTITAGTATPSGGGTVSYEYRWLVAGSSVAAAAGYTPVSGDDTKAIAAQWRAVETGGANAGATGWQTVGSGAVTYVAATAAGALSDQSYAQSSGDKTVDVSGDFTGAVGGAWSITGADATISGSGVVTIPTDTLQYGVAITVTYTNSGGATTSAFNATVAPAWVPTGADLAFDALHNRGAEGGIYYPSIQSMITAEALDFARASTALKMVGGSYVSVASGEVRVGDGGMLLEPAATNGIRNGTFAAAVVGIIGSGGVLPDGYDVSVTSGATLEAEVVAISTYLGLPAIRLRLKTTATGGDKTISFRQYTTPFPVSASSPYAISQYINILSKSGAGSVPAILGVEANAGDTFVTAKTDNITDLLGTGWTRRTVPLTTSSTTAYLRHYLMSFRVLDGTTGEIDFWICAPQVEAGGLATSPILSPVGSNATRAADILTRDVTGLGYGAEGTVLIRFNLLDAMGQAFPRIWQLDDGGNSNRVTIFYTPATSKLGCTTSVGGVVQTNINLDYVPGTYACLVFSWINDNFSVSLNGETVISVSGVIVPSGITTERIGKDGFASAQPILKITSFARWNTRLPDATLQALSA